MIVTITFVLLGDVNLLFAPLLALAETPPELLLVHLIGSISNDKGSSVNVLLLLKITLSVHSE